MADDQTIQDLIDNADPEETIVLPWRDTPYQLDGVIEISQGLTFDFNGNTILFKWQSSDGDGGIAKGFKVLASTVGDRVIFRNGIMKGYNESGWTHLHENHLGPVITSAGGSGLKIGLFQIDSIVFKDLTFGCAFNCVSGGYIRNAILSNSLFDNIVQKPNTSNDDQRGKGAAFSLNSDKSVVMSGISCGNVFRDCERHGLYVSQGGPFISQGDSFFNNCKDIDQQYVLGAIALSRNSHMRVIGAYFEDCRDGIVLSLNDPDKAFIDVSISDCTFINSRKRDISLNSGAPADNGVFRNVIVENTRHINRDPDSIQINVLAFDNMVLRNIDVEIDQSSEQTPATDYGSIYVYAYGTSNDLVIDGVKLRYRPVPTTNRGVILGALAYGTGGNSPRIRVRNVETNGNSGTAVYTGGVTPTNPKLVIASILP